jgi:putative toxin-antitoxin system antitoxin component (TIGR02293 family)
MDTQVADLLGGERVLGASVKSNLDLARATRLGLPAQTAVQLIEAIGMPAPGPLGTLIGSFRGLASPARLTPEQSDLVIRIASTLAKAIDVLGTREKAAHWLMAPKRALGGETPITLLDTSAGAHEVEALLDRIEYGVYS